MVRFVVRQRDVRRVLASGIFDRAWYEAQANQTFSTDRAAVRHYLKTGRRRGLSPSPLFEPTYFDPSRRRRFRADTLVRYLANRKGWGTASGHLIFHPGTYVKDHPESVKHRGGPLGHFLSSATADTPLQVGHALGKDVSVPWGQVRARLDAALQNWKDQERLRLAPRRTHHFDHPTARALRAEADHLPLPTSSEPLVSVVMPVWNRAQKLRRAVESVQAQTLRDWELLIVDDGSDDDTPLVLEGISAFDRRIQVMREPRSGVSRARNHGIKFARGRYVAFLDSDNAWEPHFLRTIVALMESRSLDAAHAAMEIHEDGEVTYRGFGGGLEYLLLGNHIDLNVLVVRAELLRSIGGFDEGLRRAVDYDLALRLTETTDIAYLPFVGAVYTEDSTDRTRVSVREPLTWNFVVRSAHAIDWATLRSAERIAGRTSVVVPVRDDVRMARRCVASLLADAADIEVLVVDNGSHRAASAQLASLELVDPRVRIHRVPLDLDFAGAVNQGLAQATGEYFAICDPFVVAGEGWLQPLLQSLEDDVAAVQPLVMAGDGTIHSAGLTFTSGGPLPTRLLFGHPVEDLLFIGSVQVPALDGELVLLRASDAVAMRGLDCLYADSWHTADLSLRIADGGGRCVVATDSRCRYLPESALISPKLSASDDEVLRERLHGRRPAVDASLWAAAGFRLQHHRTVVDEESRSRRSIPVLVRETGTVTDGPAAGLPSLRWAIKIAAPSGPKGLLWGDWHFAQSLAEALRRLGQDVVVDTREAVDRATAYLDDVRLVIRGLDVVQPDDGQVNLLWIISHPDDVTRDELQKCDAAFAASETWSRRVSSDWSVKVEPLLQCTDPQRFNPNVTQLPDPPAMLFVGNSRKVYRSSVRFPVEAGLDLHVYGGGWEEFLPEGRLRGLSVPNQELPSYYRSAGVVLNDHWDDMRREGFISNRIFDVAASGGRIVSDYVPGAEELFGGLLRMWSRPDELIALLGSPVDEVFPSDEERKEIADRIAAEHSFDARARRLLDVAVELRSARGGQ